MRKSIHVMAVLFLSAATASLAQQKNGGAPSPKSGMGSKAMACCDRDTKEYCSTAR